MRSRSIARDVADTMPIGNPCARFSAVVIEIAAVGAKELGPFFQAIVVDRLGVAGVEILDGELLIDSHYMRMCSR